MGSSKRLGRPAADAKRDLRAELLRTSRALLDEKGPAALSLREVARRSGCTHQAPYHYFADREAILAALVVEGFDQLAAVLAAANDLLPVAGRRAVLKASGAAYIGFALDYTGTFRIMFSPDICNPQRFPEVQQAGGRARNELSRLAAIVSGHSPAAPALETTLWAHVHGLASLLVDGRLRESFATDRERADHLASVAETFADMVLASLPGPE